MGELADRISGNQNILRGENASWYYSLDGRFVVWTGSDRDFSRLRMLGQIPLSSLMRSFYSVWHLRVELFEYGLSLLGCWKVASIAGWRTEGVRSIAGLILQIAVFFFLYYILLRVSVESRRLVMVVDIIGRSCCGWPF